MDRSDPLGIGEDGDAGLSMPESPDLMLEHTGRQSVRSPKMTSNPPPKVMGTPKRFKSSFIFFSMEKHQEIKAQLQREGAASKATNITKMVSEAWRSLTPQEKGRYEEMAREDKARYDIERANFKEEKGTVTNKKKVKDPTAPKRPMSAFLAFANSRRGEVKAQNPECSNGEISKILSLKWKDAQETVKQKYRDDEAAQWAGYKKGMLEWRKKNDGRKKASKALEAAAALKTRTKKTKKKGKPRSKNFEEEPSIADNSFDDPHFGAFGNSGLDSTGMTSQDDIMAASLALRGVRSGPSALQFGTTTSASGSLRSGGNGLAGLDGGNGMHQGLQQGGGAGYGALFGMNTMGGLGSSGGVSGSAANSVSGTGGFGQDVGSSSANRALLELGFPYQQYGSYAGVLGTNSQAMIMAQAALRGNPGAYLGLSEQQQPLSQLASLAGSQNGSTSALGQSQVSMGLGLGFSGMGGMSSMGGIGGMGGLLNDNSDGRIGSDGTMNNTF